MFLKSIELFGFKSFADRTRIDFRQGISAILGPNGCGKSNIVDGIKWVIGEQSTKMLRADRMEDVIFNGTETRSPLNVAEVTLVLSNSEGQLPIDLPEIAIKRRLFRSGESEYYINKNQVRLKEIRELFFDTGIGKSAYSVMEQGKIDQILSNKPEDRREIFEEAAGITRYRVRGAEAERKLERTEENMRQVDGILGEVKKSHDTLKVQADKTTVFRELREHVFQAELDVQLSRLREHLERKEKRQEQLVNRREQRDRLQVSIDRINESMESGMDEVNSMESRLIEAQKTLYGIDLERNNKDSQVRILGERSEELSRKIRDDESRQGSLKAKISSLTTEIKETGTQLAVLIKEIAEVEENIRTFGKDIGHFQEAVRANEAHIEDNQGRIEELDGEIEGLRIRLRGITDDIVTQLDERLREMGYSQTRRRETESRVDEIVSGLRVQIEGRTALLSDLERVSSGGSARGVAESVRTLLVELRDQIEQLVELFAEYRKATPSFLDDFLAPQGIITQKREIDGSIGTATSEIANRRQDNADRTVENRQLSARIEEYRKTLEELRVNRARMDARRSSLTERTQRMQAEIQEHQATVEAGAVEIAATQQSVNVIQKDVDKLKQEKEGLTTREADLKKNLAELESSISSLNKGLHSKEGQLKKTTVDYRRAQELVESTQVEMAEVSTEIRALYDNFQENHSRDLSEFESRMFDIKKPAKELRASLSELREKLRGLGQVNLMAPEEYAEIQERYGFLSDQMADLRKAREDLSKITQEIRKESTELFLDTYEKIKRNFHMMFRRLFGGGRAELRLLESDNILESGIEILAQPPGKKLEHIALLSGGERSLTAIALLLATYLVKPSPFCILDEIDAALDEENVGRFTSVLSEFADSSQFLIVTHNKRTVASAATLLGITMEESGVSKIIGVRLREEPASA